MTTPTPYRHAGRRNRFSELPSFGICLDFGHLENLGPCPWCEPDAENAHYLALAEAQLLSEVEEIA